MKTPICDRLGIDFPIVAFSHCRDVVIAVSKAGGIGVLGATQLTPEQLESDLQQIDKELAGLPYGVDLVLPGKYFGAESGGMTSEKLRANISETHTRFVNAILSEYDIPLPQPDESNPGRVLGNLGTMELADVAFGHPIRLIASALGPPPQGMVERAHQSGIVVAGLVGKVKHAQRHIDAGVDVIVAQGHEAGGHVGEITTMVLVPQVVDAVAPIPVLAAGGISSGRQVAAALALGAQGVWTGSVWLATREAETHPVVLRKFLEASSEDTVRSTALTGKPARQLKSAWTEVWAARTSPEPLPRPLQSLLTKSAVDQISKFAPHHPGAADLITYYVGQAVGQMTSIRSARDVVYDLVNEYTDTVERLCGDQS